MLFERIFVFPFPEIELFKRSYLQRTALLKLNSAARCLNAAFYLSHNIRRDTQVFLLFKLEDLGHLCINFVGKDLKRFQPDEHSILGLIRNSIIKFRKYERIRREIEKKFQAYPGVFVLKISFSELLSNLIDEDYQILYSSAKGTDVRKIKFTQKLAFITANKNTLNEKDWEILRKNGVGIHFGDKLPRIDIQVILLHNELDRVETKYLSNSL